MNDTTGGGLRTSDPALTRGWWAALVGSFSVQPTLRVGGLVGSFSVQENWRTGKFVSRKTDRYGLVVRCRIIAGSPFPSTISPCSMTPAASVQKSQLQRTRRHVVRAVKEAGVGRSQGRIECAARSPVW